MKISKKLYLKTIGVFSLVLILGLISIFFFRNSQNTNTFTDNNVELKNGVQIINIKAGLGYSPNRIQAQANTPTKLLVQTNNTYDCTAYLNIPKLGIKEFLPPTGVTEVELQSHSSGEEIEGFCGSDTYKFVIKFS